VFQATLITQPPEQLSSDRDVSHPPTRIPSRDALGHNEMRVLRAAQNDFQTNARE